MAIQAKNFIIYVRRCLLFPLKIGYRLAQDRPFSLGMVIFLQILHRYCPALFEFLVSSSPVFVCTALLLGTLLVFGEPDTPDTKAAHIRNKTRVKENNVKEAGKEQAIAGITTVEDVPLTSVCGACSEKDEISLAARSSVADGIQEIDGDMNGNNAIEFHNQRLHKKKEISEGKQAEDIGKASEDGGPTKTVKSDLERDFGSSLAFSRQTLEGRDFSSGSETDEGENSSPDASVADIIPMLDELHPLLDSEAPQPAHISADDSDNSDAASSMTSQDNESDDASVEEEAENQEDEEDEEAQEEKDDTNEAVVTWTADDQKNLMDLGSSELERNQRLENLLAKRRARKFLSFHAQKNLIDLDSDDPVLNMGDSPRFQIAPISAPRRNPFDLPFDAEENMGLPPIPGSAPSVLQPRQNPFDLPLDQAEESDSLKRVTMSIQEFTPASQRAMSYRKHESITLGASLSGDCKEELHYSKLNPYFVPERMDLEETSSAVLRRQSSENSDSKVTSANESDTNSSSIDQEDHKELIEEFHLENRLNSSESHYVVPVEQGSLSSEEVDSVDNVHEDADDDHAIQLNSSIVAQANHLAVDAFGAVEMEIRQGESHSPDSHGGSLEEIEEMYGDSSSSSSEAYGKSSKNDSKDFSESMLPVPADSDTSNATEVLDNSQHADPVYDSSPSAVEKSLSNIPKFDESLLYAGKGSSSSNSMASDVQLGSSELGSLSSTHANKVSLEESDSRSISESIGEDLSSGTTELRVPPPSSASADEIESRLMEETETMEQDTSRAVPPEVVNPAHLSIVDNSNKDIADKKDLMINTEEVN